jgi:hypothetical protein
MYCTGGSDYQMDLTQDPLEFKDWSPFNGGWIVFVMHPNSKIMIVASMNNGRFVVFDTEKNAEERSVDGHKSPV